MKTNTKQKLIICCIIGVLIGTVFLGLSILGVFDKQNAILEQGVLAEIPIDEALSDEDMVYAYENYPRIVLITNLSDLAGTELTSYALNSLEGYLDRYMRYYITTDPRYKGYIIKSSYCYDLNFPSFTVYIEELDMNIECYYNICTKRYIFKSELDRETS